jgi:hypothetical protein
MAHRRHCDPVREGQTADDDWREQMRGHSAVRLRFGHGIEPRRKSATNAVSAAEGGDAHTLPPGGHAHPLTHGNQWTLRFRSNVRPASCKHAHANGRADKAIYCYGTLMEIF